jgi:hypothetical protein
MGGGGTVEGVLSRGDYRPCLPNLNSYAPSYFCGIAQITRFCYVMFRSWIIFLL